MKKLPRGISNYEQLVEENYIYVDKTKYIEQLENLSDRTIMFLRPRKFGKTLFTSVLENYYDKLKIDKFDELYSNTYIGKNPTKNKNRYCILRFNFSGIDTADYDSTINGFKKKVIDSIKDFVNKYKIDFLINENQNAEEMLGSILLAFKMQKVQEKIYVIIDEYDHFANELLGFRVEEFRNLMSKNGKVRKWYEILKEGTESVIDRIFITGVTPITLDSMTSGFNISRNITKDRNFNEMLGFTEEEVKYLMDELEIEKEKQEELLPIIKRNYDGYIFSDTIKSNYENYKIYNSNMTLYFLNNYIEMGEIPEELVDVNIISDYRKIEGMMNLCTEDSEILQNLVEDTPIESEIINSFNPEIAFGERELASLLYYLGYVTIKNNEFGISQLIIPNDVIKKIYAEYFIKYLSEKAEMKVNLNQIELTKEILLEGKIEKITEKVEEYLRNLSNRDYQKFDEKYVKVIFYSICRMLGALYVKSELEVGGKYSDLLIIPTEKIEERYSVLVEFKYIKQEEYDKDENILKERQEEAKEQIKKYSKTEEIELLPKVRKYSVVTVKDKIYVEEVE